MKIGLITDSIDMKAPGIGRYIKNLVKELVQVSKSQNNNHEFILIHQNVSKDKLYSLEGVNEIIVRVPSVPFGRELRKLYLLPKELKKYNFDIVHDLAQVGPFVSKSSYKAVETIHDLSSLTHPEFHTMSTIYRTRIGFLLIKKNVDMFITVSNASKEVIVNKLKILDEKVKVIYEAVDPVFKEIDTNNRLIEYSFILFVGTIEPRKNLENLIKAFEIINKSNKEIKLVIVGKKGWKSKAVINYINNNQAIIWKQNVNDVDLNLLYNQAEILVMPSFVEGFGLPIVEAMSCGCPVAVSDIPVFREVVDDTGVYFDPHNHEDIANKISKIIFNKNIQEQLSGKSFHRSKFFSWKKHTKELLSYYEQIT